MDSTALVTQCRDCNHVDGIKFEYASGTPIPKSAFPRICKLCGKPRVYPIRDGSIEKSMESMFDASAALERAMKSEPVRL